MMNLLQRGYFTAQRDKQQKRFVSVGPVAGRTVDSKMLKRSLECTGRLL